MQATCSPTWTPAESEQESPGPLTLHVERARGIPEGHHVCHVSSDDTETRDGVRSSEDNTGQRNLCLSSSSMSNEHLDSVCSPWSQDIHPTDMSVNSSHRQSPVVERKYSSPKQPLISSQLLLSGQFCTRQLLVLQMHYTKHERSIIVTTLAGGKNPSLCPSDCMGQ